MLFDPTDRNVDPFLFPTGIRTMKELVLVLAIHDRTSPWPSQHKWSSSSGQDRRLHLKTAEPPRLTETMSLASPDSPNRGSSSRCQSLGVRWPSTNLQAMASIAAQCVAL